MASRHAFCLFCVHTVFSHLGPWSIVFFVPPKKKPFSTFVFSMLYRTATGGGVAWHNFINAEAMAFMRFSCILGASASSFNECFELA